MAKEQFPKPFGKYILLEKIALGGMAELFRAKTIGAEGFEREVVIKRILPHFTEDENFTKMFIDEARIAAKLHHANVVQIFDFDKVEDDYYIAMEFVEGRDVKKIRERLKKKDIRLGVWQSVFIIIEVAKALQYAHSRTHKGNPLNIIHRDVSPQNILVSYAGEVKLMDFGIAKAQERSTKTRAGTVKGKCAYMSPEQARGKPLDKRSDLFGLGVILWELLTGKRLFAGETDFETLSNVLKCEVTRPSEHNSDVPRELDEIVLKALAKETDDRYDDCGGFQKELSRLFYSSVEDMEAISLSHMMEEHFRGEIEALSDLDSGKTMMLQDMIAQQRKSVTGMPIVPPLDPSVSITGPIQPPPFNLGGEGSEATMALPAFSESTSTDEIEDEDLKSTMPLSDLQAQALEQLKLNPNAAAENQVTGSFRGPPAFGPNSGSYTGLHARKKISPVAAVMLTLGAIGTAFAVVLVVMSAQPSNGGGENPDVTIASMANIHLSAEPDGLSPRYFVNGNAITGSTYPCELGVRIKVQAKTGDRQSDVEEHICSDDAILRLKLNEAGPKQIKVQIVAQGAEIRINGEAKGKDFVSFMGDENSALLIEADYGNGQVEKKTITLNGSADVVTMSQSIQEANLVVKVTPQKAIVEIDGTRYLPVQGVARIPDQRFGKEMMMTVTARNCTENIKTFIMSAASASQEVKLECRTIETTRYGKVTIRSRPWAYVFLKGRQVGTTPMTGKTFRAGTYNFVLKTTVGREKKLQVTIPVNGHAKPAIVNLSQP